MILIEPRPLNDPDRKAIEAWLQHPGCEIYQRCLASQEAEKLAEGANASEKDDLQPDALVFERDQALLQAKVIRAAIELLKQAKKIALEKGLDTDQEKPQTFYTVELKPDTRP